MYMLNLKFDANRTDGIFEDDVQGAAPLATSKEWLSAADPNPWPSVFNPSNYTWTDDGPDNSLTLSSRQNPGQILIRVYGVNLPAGNTTIRLSVVFGRLRRNSSVASPFTLSQTPGGAACTVFDSNFDGPSPDGSWCWKLGPVVNFPTTPNGANKYEFVVGITVVLGNGQWRTFGHDPEMDVEF